MINSQGLTLDSGRKVSDPRAKLGRTFTVMWNDRPRVCEVVAYNTDYPAKYLVGMRLDDAVPATFSTNVEGIFSVPESRISSILCDPTLLLLR
ncbi:hypothetical protein [Chroococcidiopsis sp.]|uniref:hypothetical protein n=1 Tax=Chroococcidiopsis sp. TaxID=3088168 RepID=UPI003F3B628B